MADLFDFTAKSASAVEDAEEMFERLAEPRKSIEDIHQPEEHDEFGSIRHTPCKHPAKAPRKKQVDNTTRTRDLLVSRGFVAVRADRTVQKRIGPAPSDVMVFTEDLLGFVDILAFPAHGTGPCVAVQLTSKDAMGERIRKMCKKEDPRRGEPVCLDALIPWLRSGQRVIVIGWYQPGGPGSKWAHEEKEVTLDTIALVESRRRK